MRILSKYKDYYDCSHLQDYDNSCLYVRNKTEVKFTEAEQKQIKMKYFNCVIGFCGKLYVVNYLGDIVLFGEDAKKYKIDKKTIYSPYYKQEYYLTERKLFGLLLKWHDEEINNLLNNKFLLSLFLKHNTPTFVVKLEWNRPTLTINHPLKDLQFFKMFNSVQAFQEIEMFLSNILINDKMVVPDRNDEEIGTSKGFDKNSFKNNKKQSKKF